MSITFKIRSLREIDVFLNEELVGFAFKDMDIDVDERDYRWVYFHRDSNVEQLKALTLTGMKAKLKDLCYDYLFQGTGPQPYIALIEKIYQQNKKDEVAIISKWAARSCGSCGHLTA